MPSTAALLLLAGFCLTASCQASDPLAPKSAAVRATPLKNTSPLGKTGFSLIPPSLSGLVFTNRLDPLRSITNQIFHNGSGVAAGDVDGDGRCDLFFAAIEGGNRLFLNQGNWRFAEAADAGGASCPGLHVSGVTLTDLNGDLRPDLLVNTYGRGTLCFLNQGGARFENISARSGLATHTTGMSVALADVEGDGDLDLYVAHYRSQTLRDEPDTRFRLRREEGRLQIEAVNGLPVSHPSLLGRFTVDPEAGILEHGEPDALYLNQGNSVFRAVPWTNGVFADDRGQPIPIPYDWGLTGFFRDLDGNGAPDLYVCNDFDSPDRIWMNQGDGHFRALPPEALGPTSRFSMGVDVADINRDGEDDILVVDMLSRDHRRRQVQLANRRGPAKSPDGSSRRPDIMRNTLHLRRSDGTYAEIARLAGIESSEWSWVPRFLDVDLDGYEDILVANGHLRDVQHMDHLRDIETRKRNPGLSRLERLRLRESFPRLDTPNCAFRNRGDLTFEDTSEPWGFAIPSVAQGMALADLDGDGDLDVALNQLNGPAILLRNDSPAPRVAVRLRGALANSQGIGAKVRLIGGPVPQSQEIIAGGRYLSSDDPLLAFATGESDTPKSLEVTWRNGERTFVPNVLAGQLYEISETPTRPRPAGGAPQQPAPPSSARPSPLNPGRPFDWIIQRITDPSTLPARLGVNPSDLPPAFRGPRKEPDSTLPPCPFAIGDDDGDGDLDLFLGGTTLEGRHPEPASSTRFRNHQGRLLPDESAHRWLARTGRVTAAISSDLDGDGRSDWILACEWGSLRVFQVQKETLEETTTRWGLDRWTGWWTDVVSADFDGDGRQDLAVGNLGLNTGHRPSPGLPDILVFGDLAGDGGFGSIEGYHDASLPGLLPRITLDALATRAPSLAQRFQSFAAYSQARLPEVVGKPFTSIERLEANTAESMVFLNRRGRFEGRPLPRQCQFAPVTSIAIGDLDGDGRVDLLLKAKCPGEEDQPLPCSGLRPVVCLGDGMGGFHCLEYSAGPR